MAFKVEWSDNAIEDFEGIVSYLLKKWSGSVADEFIRNVDIHLEKLCNFPFTGIISNKDASTRYVVITRHNKLYYQVINDVIHVLNIFDTRQDPAKNRLE